MRKKSISSIHSCITIQAPRTKVVSDEFRACLKQFTHTLLFSMHSLFFSVYRKNICVVFKIKNGIYIFNIDMFMLTMFVGFVLYIISGTKVCYAVCQKYHVCK